MATLDSYDGTPTTAQLGNASYGLVPDGVSALQWTLRSGRVQTLRATGNLVETSSSSPNLAHRSVASILRWLDRKLPVSERELSPSGYAIATFAQPSGYLKLANAAFRFELTILTKLSTTTSTGTVTTSGDSCKHDLCTETIG